MKILVILSVLLFGFAVFAAPPVQKQRIALATKNTHCPKCLAQSNKFLSVSTITNAIANGINAPRVTLERYNLECKECKLRFRRLEILPLMAPTLPTPHARKAIAPKYR